MGDRMQLDQFKGQLGEGASALKDDQAKQMMQLMREERERTPPVIPDNPADSDVDFKKLLSGDAMEKQMQWQEEQNRRVLERAGTILTPEQLKAFTEFQAQQASLQKLGLKMAKELFGDDKPAPK